MTDEPHDHDGTTCPQCQRMSEAVRVLGGFALALERALEDGTFHRIGEEMARRREEEFWKAFFEEPG